PWCSSRFASSRSNLRQEHHAAGRGSRSRVPVTIAARVAPSGVPGAVAFTESVAMRLLILRVNGAIGGVDIDHKRNSYSDPGQWCDALPHGFTETRRSDAVNKYL